VPGKHSGSRHPTRLRGRWQATGAGEERLERLKARRSAPDLVETLIAISQHCSSLPDRDTRSADELLGYDDFGAFDGTSSASGTSTLCLSPANS
jgi:hypothetical protein